MQNGRLPFCGFLPRRAASCRSFFTSFLKYRRHKATGQAVVTLNGRDFYLGPWQSAASKRDYAWMTSEWLAAGCTLPMDNASRLKVVQLLAAFWQHAKRHYVGPNGKPTSEQLNYNTLIKRLRTTYGDTPVKDFGPLRLKAFRASLIEEKLARTNINQQIYRVRRIIKWGVENELVEPAVDAADDMPSSAAYRSRFGSLISYYRLAGYDPVRDYRYLETNRELRELQPKFIAELVQRLGAVGATVTRDAATGLLLINGILACDSEVIALPLERILPMRVLGKNIRNSPNYRCIEASMRELGLIEPLIIFPQPKVRDSYLLLDGHLRHMILKSLRCPAANCLVATDDEAFTYNHRVTESQPCRNTS